MSVINQGHEEVAIGLLTPHPDNPRRGNVEAIRDSIATNGFYGSLVVQRSTGHVLVGNHRLYAARELGYETVPVTYVDVDDAAARRILAADNRTSDLGDYEDQALVALLEEIRGDGGLVGTGYDDDDLEQLLALLSDVDDEGEPYQGFTDPDEVPEPPQEPVTRLGDLWVLGEHRLLCGDSTKRADLDRVLAGRAIDLVVTDPPYGVAIGAKNRALQEMDRAGRRIEDLSGDQGAEEVDALWRSVFGHLEAMLAPGVPFYTFGPQGGDLGLLLLLLQQVGLPARHILIWVKNRASFSMGRLDYEYQHEPILYGWKQGGAHPWFADETRTSLFHHDRPQASPDHATTKPVGLIAELIANSAPHNGVVFDPFIGSGTALIAAQQLGRVGCGVDVSPQYVDVTCRRYQEFTGNKPVLEATGEPHDFVGAD